MRGVDGAEGRTRDRDRVKGHPLLEMQDSPQGAVVIDEGDLLARSKSLRGRPVLRPTEREQDGEAPGESVRETPGFDHRGERGRVHESLERGKRPDPDLLEVVELVERGGDRREYRQFGFASSSVGVAEPPFHETAPVGGGDHTRAPPGFIPLPRTKARSEFRVRQNPSERPRSASGKRGKANRRTFSHPSFG